MFLSNPALASHPGCRDSSRAGLFSFMGAAFGRAMHEKTLAEEGSSASQQPRRPERLRWLGLGMACCGWATRRGGRRAAGNSVHRSGHKRTELLAIHLLCRDLLWKSTHQLEPVSLFS